MTKVRLLKYMGLAFIMAAGLVISYALVIASLVYQTTHYLKRHQFNKAVSSAELGLKLLQPLQLANLNQTQLAESAIAFFKLLNIGGQLAPSLTTSTNLANLDLRPLLNQAPRLVDGISAIETQLEQNQLLVSLVQKLDLPVTLSQTISFIKHNNQLIKNVIVDLKDQDQTWLVVFQNNNELRATGGFMGSYALVTIKQGKIEQVNIEDIYDADGQFQGFVEPPAGVKQYLSAARGLRLPDSNWSPDFPTAAQQALVYFALGKKTKLKGVVFIDNQLVKNLIKLTGPLYIPDYQKYITADNFDTQLQNRGGFFPGDKTKKHLLSLVFNQLTFKFNKAIKQNPARVLTLILEAVKQKQIQAFSLDPDYQALLIQLGLTNQLTDQPSCLDLALVESNVGINKVNQVVSRDVFITLDNHNQQSRPVLAIKINFGNQAKREKKGQNEYVNYQRVFIEPNWLLKEVRVNDQVVRPVDDELVSTDSKDQFRQIGFLVVTKPQSRSNAEITLVNQTLQPPTKLCLFKQPGLPPTSYTINVNIDEQAKVSVVNLTQDQEVELF